MSGKCNLSECPAPDAPCHLGNEDYTKCEHFVLEVIPRKNTKEKVVDIKKASIGWSGQAFIIDELGLVSSRTSPILIGIVGKADAGKTSFLAMLYTLLLNGRKFKTLNFAGSKTTLGWDELYHKLKLKKGNVSFPAPTPVSSNRLYHFALRDDKYQLKDILFTDTSGEVFSYWAVDRGDERAIIQDGFMLTQMLLCYLLTAKH